MYPNQNGASSKSSGKARGIPSIPLEAVLSRSQSAKLKKT
jgi:hypothetical protein